MPDTASDRYQLFASKGCGSVLTEALLELAGLPYEVEYLPFDSLGPNCAPLRDLNPLGQVPTLRLPGGEIMTESAAIALLVSERARRTRLAPALDEPGRATFLRWLVFLAANVYPTFAYGDFPDRFVSSEAAHADLRERVLEHRQRLWRQMDAALQPKPWALGERFSALDVFIAVMTRSTPGREWFAANTPGLAGIAKAADAKPELAQVWARNFG